MTCRDPSFGRRRERETKKRPWLLSLLTILLVVVLAGCSVRYWVQDRFEGLRDWTEYPSDWEPPESVEPPAEREQEQPDPRAATLSEDTRKVPWWKRRIHWLPGKGSKVPPVPEKYWAQVETGMDRARVRDIVGPPRLTAGWGTELMDDQRAVWIYKIEDEPDYHYLYFAGDKLVRIHHQDSDEFINEEIHAK
ncbi:MAG: hypothetical protein JW937_06420 [Candidatus Omnitrophica bacterium]|nr:hypothetical protein [Candidatus Omnitrophota bacterium]